MISEFELKMIKKILLKSHEEFDVDDMLSTAKFKVLCDGSIGVKYDEGTTERYVYIRTLVHELDLPECFGWNDDFDWNDD